MTLVSHSRYVGHCLDAAAVLAKEGVECEVEERTSAQQGAALSRPLTVLLSPPGDQPADHPSHGRGVH